MNIRSFNIERAEWLYRLMPDYAKGCIFTDAGVIDWDALIATKEKFSTGELCAVALAAHVDDRIGIVLAVQPWPMSVMTLLGNLEHSARIGWIGLCAMRVQEIAR